MCAAKHATMARVNRLLVPSEASQSDDDDAREHRRAGLEDTSEGERKFLLEAQARFVFFFRGHFPSPIIVC